MNIWHPGAVSWQPKGQRHATVQRHEIVVRIKHGALSRSLQRLPATGGEIRGKGLDSHGNVVSRRSPTREQIRDGLMWFSSTIESLQFAPPFIRGALLFAIRRICEILGNSLISWILKLPVNSMRTKLIFGPQKLFLLANYEEIDSKSANRRKWASQFEIHASTRYSSFVFRSHFPRYCL